MDWITLAELAEVLKARDAGGAPCRRVYQLAQEKLKGIEADIEAMKRTKRTTMVTAHPRHRVVPHILQVVEEIWRPTPDAFAPMG